MAMNGFKQRLTSSIADSHKKNGQVFYPKVLRKADCENVYETGSIHFL